MRITKIKPASQGRQGAELSEDSSARFYLQAAEIRTFGTQEIRSTTNVNIFSKTGVVPAAIKGPTGMP
ncbi:hypothetical protein, partial [Paenibacillus sp. GbtcB18]|uniref:hypothetical protein n=1 Tax=Paenibacillus sp. GbtcB18 TaxID=2824763 RepID=UPI001C310898